MLAQVRSRRIGTLSEITLILLLPMVVDAQEISLKIVRPTPGENLTITHGSTFVIGTVSPPQATVVVNGTKADVSDDGAFLAFAPVKLLSKPQSLKMAEGKQKRVDAVFDLVARAEGKESRKRILVATPVVHKVAEPALKPFARPIPYRVREEQVLSRTANTNWGLLYLPVGAAVAANARKGDQVRLQLPETQETWVAETTLQRADSMPAIAFEPLNRVSSGETRFPLTALAPYSIEALPSASKLRLTIYSPDSARAADVPCNGNLWGFTTRVEQRTIILTQRWPSNPKPGLRDKIICLDPGHNPDTGAVGPRGLAEKVVNLKVGLALEKLLANAGAKVVFTHRDEPLPLLQRRPAALKLNPDIFVSLHNNSVPDGTDPRTNFGTSTFYYHPHSKPLADAVQAAMLKALGWPDQKVNQKSLAVCRISEFPAILVEPAYIILPDQEKFLLSQAGQQKIAQSVFEGIRSFFESSN
jgi:N-acetylmuramoyl-L-alanine amidase